MARWEKKKTCRRGHSSFVPSSCLMLVLLDTKLTSKPRASHVPVGQHCSLRNLEHFGCLDDTQAAENPQLDYLAFSWICRGKTLQRVVERDEIRSAVNGKGYS